MNLNKIKLLRDNTGASILLCKKALEEKNGNIEEALKFLQNENIIKANKKVSRNVSQGIISSYIHPGSKIGVLLELNCETDFVAKDLKFITLANNIMLQIVSNPEIKYIDIPENLENFNKDEILLCQPYIFNSKITMSDFIKEHISLFGENIKVNRFIKFILGEKN